MSDSAKNQKPPGESRRGVDLWAFVGAGHCSKRKRMGITR